MRLRRLSAAFLCGSMVCALTNAQIPAGNTSRSRSSPPDTQMLLANASHAFSSAGGRLIGEGRTHLLQQVAGAQFVLIGESHYDHDTPLFAVALYRELNSELGFHHLVVEQDPVGIEDSFAAGARGDAAAIAQIARRDPYLLGFSSDQDLQLLADVGRLEKNADPIWGLQTAISTGLPPICIARRFSAKGNVQIWRHPHVSWIGSRDGFSDRQSGA
jgi:hypothetical protein